MAGHAELQEGLRRSNARFVATMNSVLERYNHPFEDDFVVSLDTLTYDTPEGPKRWEHVSRKDIKTWMAKMFKNKRQSRRKREIPKQQRSDFEEEHSSVHQESSESSGEDTSDTGEARDVISVRKRFQDLDLQNLDVDDGKIQKKEKVRVDVIVQDDERGIPKWITIPSPRSSKGHRLTSSVREQTGEARDIVSVRKKIQDFDLQNLDVDGGKIQKKEKVRVDVIVQDDERGIPKWITIPSPGWSKRHRLTSPVRERTGEACDTVSVRKKIQGFDVQNLDVDGGKIQKKEKVRVDVIVQDDERGIPKWITIPSPGSSKRRLTSPVREQTGEARDVISVRKRFQDLDLQNLDVDGGKIQKKEKVRVDVIVQDDERGIPKWMMIPSPGWSKRHRLTSPVREQNGEARDIVSVRKKIQDFDLQNLDVDDRKIQKKEKVRVDVIVQDDERGIPKWITRTPPGSSKRHHLTSPVQEQNGNQAAACRKKLELSNESSSSKYLHSEHYSDVPMSSNTVTKIRHGPCPELSETCCDSIHGEYQLADEECSWSNTTLADLYPAMVEIFTRLMTKQSQRKVFKYICKHLRSKRWHSKRPKLSVTADKIRGFRPRKPKKACHSICSCRSEDEQNPTFGNESREFHCDNCLIRNSSDLVPYAYTDTNEIKMDCSDSSLKQHLASGKGQKIFKYTAFPDVMARIGDTFLGEDEWPTASLKNSEYIESEELAYEHPSEYSFITSTVSSDSRVPHLVKKSKRKTQKADFSRVGTSEFCSSVCSCRGNSNNSTPITNCSPARSSNTVLINSEKMISERQASFQHKHSFFPWFMKQSPSKMPHKHKDAFEEHHYRTCSEEFQKPLTLTRPLLKPQKLKEKGRLVKSNLSDFARSTKQCDIEFDRLYEEVCREAVLKFPGFQRASNLRKYEEIEMPQTVNALVNSPVRSYSAISRVKRGGNFQNSLPCSPVKRLKLIPEHYCSSRKCQKISHIENVNLQTAGMDFLSTCNCSNPSFLADHSHHCQDSEFHDSSDKTYFGIPDNSLQGACSCCPGAIENCSSPRKVRKRHERVYRKLSYTDGKDQL